MQIFLESVGRVLDIRKFPLQEMPQAVTCGIAGVSFWGARLAGVADQAARASAGWAYTSAFCYAPKRSRGGGADAAGGGGRLVGQGQSEWRPLGPLGSSSSQHMRTSEIVL